ncbi:MFS transporter [Brevibacterium album]|uniref:MFS transporter n=1 Tax=Brevibacterium album TaxID=417948 RepID=UPI0004000D78|nr:MFS transporter [Brevibacterium album]
MSQGRLWNRDFSIALGMSVFLAFVFYLLVTSMAGYAALRFAAGEAQAGMAASAFVLGSVLTRTAAGKLLDVVGRRRLLVLSMVTAVLVSLAYFVVGDLVLLIAARLLHGMMFGVGHTVLAAGVQDLIPSERRSEGTGYFAASVTLSSALGPLIAVTTVGEWGYQALFAISLGFSLVGCLGLFFLRLPERELSAAQRRRALSLRPSSMVDAEGLRMGIVIFLSGAAYSAVLAFLAAHAQGIPGGSPTYFMCFALSSLLARLSIGRVQDRRGDNIVLYPLFVSFAGSCTLLALWPTQAGLALAGLLGGFGYGSLITCAQAIAVRMAGPARVGLVTSTYLLSMDLGLGLGAILLGLAAGPFGYEVVYLLAAGLVVLAGGAYFLLHGHKPEAGPAGAAGARG